MLPTVLRSFCAGHAGVRYDVDQCVPLRFGEAHNCATLDVKSMAVRGLFFC